MNTSTEEKKLLHEIAGGQERAFRILFDQYKDKVYSYAYNFTQSGVQSEEVVQEIFLKVWAGREKLAAIERFESWLFMITRNLCLNLIKKMAYDYSYRKSLPDDPYENAVEGKLLYKQYSQLIRQAVDQLPFQQKRIYNLRREEGLSIKEIAEGLGISANTVKVQLNRTLRHIRKELEGKIEPIVILILTTFFIK